MWLKKIKMAVRMLAKSKLVSINLWLNVHLVPPVQTYNITASDKTVYRS